MPCLTRGGWRGWKAGPGLRLRILRTHQTCDLRRERRGEAAGTAWPPIHDRDPPWRVTGGRAPPRALPTPRRLPSPDTDPASLVQGIPHLGVLCRTRDGLAIAGRPPCGPPVPSGCGSRAADGLEGLGSAQHVREMISFHVKPNLCFCFKLGGGRAQAQHHGEPYLVVVPDSAAFCFSSNFGDDGGV